MGDHEMEPHLEQVSLHLESFKDACSKKQYSTCRQVLSRLKDIIDEKEAQEALHLPQTHDRVEEQPQDNNNQLQLQLLDAQLEDNNELEDHEDFTQIPLDIEYLKANPWGGITELEIGDIERLHGIDEANNEQQQLGGSNNEQQQQQLGGSNNEQQQQQQLGGSNNEQQQQQKLGGSNNEQQQQQQLDGSNNEQQQQQLGDSNNEQQQQQQLGGSNNDEPLRRSERVRTPTKRMLRSWEQVDSEEEGEEEE